MGNEGPVALSLKGGGRRGGGVVVVYDVRGSNKAMEGVSLN